MSSLQGLILWQGVLSTSSFASISFTPASNTNVFVTSIMAVNVSGSPVTANIGLQQAGGSSPLHFRQKDMPLAAGGAAGSDCEFCRDSQQVRLSPGDMIFGDASVGSAVEVTIMGCIIS